MEEGWIAAYFGILQFGSHHLPELTVMLPILPLLIFNLINISPNLSPYPGLPGSSLVIPLLLQLIVHHIVLSMCNRHALSNSLTHPVFLILSCIHFIILDSARI